MPRTAPTEQPKPSGLRPFRRILSTAPSPERIDGITTTHTALLGESVSDILGAGLGIIFAPTRDLGAIAITLLDGDEREKGYASDSESLRVLLEALRDTANSRRLTGD